MLTGGFQVTLFGPTEAPKAQSFSQAVEGAIHQEIPQLEEKHPRAKDASQGHHH